MGDVLRISFAKVGSSSLLGSRRSMITLVLITAMAVPGHAVIAIARRKFVVLRLESGKAYGWQAQTLMADRDQQLPS